MNKNLKEDLEKKIKPGWAIEPGKSNVSLDDNKEADDGYVQTGLEGNKPSNYENNLIGNPKGLTDFEVSKSPGRLG